MQFDTPAGPNPIDRQTIVGKAHLRIDGPLKTTGTAPYAYERHDVVANQAYGFILGAAIAKGRIEQIDRTRAERAPGVLAVVTYENGMKVGKAKAIPARLMGGPDIEHYDQAIAIVVAETFEQARAAAKLIDVRYVRADGAYDLAAGRATAYVPNQSATMQPPESAVGDFAGAFAAAPVKLDETYTTPDQSHSMMEPQATIAAWDNDRLSIWCSSQMIAWARRDLSEILGMQPENIHVQSPYIGGGFGAKLWIRGDVVMAALGARAAGRPVKVALTRPQMTNATSHRPATIQRIRLAAGQDGKLQAIAHEGWSGNMQGGRAETAIMQTRQLYAAPNRMTAQRMTDLDLPEGNAMRAPGEAPGLMALEIAMDEMAEKLGMDPVEFRLLNDTQVDPEKPDRPFSQRNLAGCLRTGAAQFGWGRRQATPGSVRDGRWLLGLGMAAAYRPNNTVKSAARVTLGQDGIVTVRTDMTDIGTGSYTIIAQTAAEMLGVPMQRVRVLLGDSAFPVSSGSGGQFGANSSTAGVYAACVALRKALAEQAGLDPDTADFTGGTVTAGGKSFDLASMARDGDITAEDGIVFSDLTKRYVQATFGGQFCEVGVDAATGEVRVRRMTGVFACGRIINPVTARSQVLGGMTMGIGAALMEEAVVDTRLGYFVNHDLAEYHVPTHADVPHQEVTFLDEADPASSPMKAKGVGEVGICGAAAAVSNAVYNACGIRIRDYPITPDKLLAGLPAFT